MRLEDFSPIERLKFLSPVFSFFLISLLFFYPEDLQAQAENIRFSNKKLPAMLVGDYNPNDYVSSSPITDAKTIYQALVSNVNSDSLKSYLEVLSSFETRNTGSDTMSTSRGIGAAQRWCLSQFDLFDQNNEGRLETSFFSFDQDICGMGRHKNVLAMLPGQGPQKDEVIVVVAHLDSRCEDGCDVDCEAQGMEDNGSGSALVLELSRVMSAFTFNRSLVFLLTTAEEQGLLGAEAFANYCKEQGVKVYAAYNNDIVGGVICGATASPPGCPYMNHIDSINVRVYSQGSRNSKHKMLARFLQREYDHHMAPLMKVKNVVNLMSPEDRSGRGGDHIAFRRAGYATVRFSSANEHGDGNPSQMHYHDRQHTMDDILGLDTNGDNILDSFFVDFNYLGRNAMINGGAIASAALGPVPVQGFALEELSGGFGIAIEDSLDYNHYLIGVRRLGGVEYDTTYEIFTKRDTLPVKEPFWYYINVASIDSNGVQSLFCIEEDVRIRTTATRELVLENAIDLLQNYPNPFDDATTFAVVVNELVPHNQAEIRVYDRLGRSMATLPIELQLGTNEILYQYHNHHYRPGVYHYALWIDGKRIDVKSMIYAY